VKIEKGMRLPDARLSTLGGTSFATGQLRGRRAVVYGWGSWSPSREALPALQKFHEKTGMELVTVAFEVAGPAAAMKHLHGLDHTALIDATCTLTRRWGVRSVPFALLLDEDGVVLIAAEEADEKFLLQAAKAAKARPKPFPKIPPAETKRQFDVEVKLQACTNFLGRKRTDDALSALHKALDLDPENAIIQAQLDAMTR
jgi:hypothetical protein